MIYTANTTFDKNHLANFTKEVARFDNDPKTVTSYRLDRGVFVQHINDYLDVYMKAVRTHQGNGYEILITDARNNPVLVARVMSAPIPQGILPWGYKNYIMDKVKVHIKWAGRGVTGALYTWLADRGFTIISDSHQNQNSLAVWKKLASTQKVFMFDMARMAWKPYDPVKTEDWVVFGNGNLVEYWPIRFVLPGNQ
jgi:hypothetical protein